MKLAAILFLSAAVLPSAAFASSTQCESDKYHQYVDASLAWYQDLIDLAVAKDASLTEVGKWFLNGRKHHFEFNRDAVDWYLENDREKLNLSQPVESWLDLSQHNVKILAKQDTRLGKAAKQAFDDRQNKPHAKNYALRTAFATLLTHPGKIEQPLNNYNHKMNLIAMTECP
ncbi:hypothetical protein [Photobacterium nomapromontoriensis]|uniref:hypothetical protein n=1 Tax=Photobacterium nomapromontoriensis TaxID=2910237 RepID=UPI003D0CF415